MSKLRCHISISADGFVAGPNQSEENPLGEGGERLHDWAVSLAAWRESHGKPGGECAELAGGANLGRGHAVELARHRLIRPMPISALTHR